MSNDSSYKARRAMIFVDLSTEERIASQQWVKSISLDAYMTRWSNLVIEGTEIVPPTALSVLSDIFGTSSERLAAISEYLPWLIGNKGYLVVCYESRDDLAVLYGYYLPDESFRSTGVYYCG